MERSTVSHHRYVECSNRATQLCIFSYDHFPGERIEEAIDRYALGATRTGRGDILADDMMTCTYRQVYAVQLTDRQACQKKEGGITGA